MQHWMFIISAGHLAWSTGQLGNGVRAAPPGMGLYEAAIGFSGLGTCGEQVRRCHTEARERRLHVRLSAQIPGASQIKSRVEACGRSKLTPAHLLHESQEENTQYRQLDRRQYFTKPTQASCSYSRTHASCSVCRSASDSYLCNDWKDEEALEPEKHRHIEAQSFIARQVADAERRHPNQAEI